MVGSCCILKDRPHQIQGTPQQWQCFQAKLTDRPFVNILLQPEAKAYDGPPSVPARRHATSADILEAANDLLGVKTIALEAETVSEAAQAVVDMLQSVRVGVVVLRGPVLEVLVELFQHHLLTENEVWS